MMKRTLTPAELRARPGLLDELRSQGTPAGYAMERRFGAPAELRPAESGENRSAGEWRGGGAAIVYNSQSENLGGFVEVIMPGAARDVLARNPDVRGLFNHDPNYVLGRTHSGTLRLTDTESDLDYEFDAPDTSYARDLHVLMERGDVTQSSFAFRVAPDGAEWDEDPDTGLLLRRVHRFSHLFDVSPVTYPAYVAATSGVRSEPVKAESDDDPSALLNGREGEDDELKAERARVAYEARQRRLRLRERALNRH